MARTYFFERWKTCAHCNERFVAEAAVQKFCKTCAPDYAAGTRISRYGISQQEYERFYEIQSGACAICRLPFSSVKINVDHNHETQKVRGLLCTRCNLALGSLEANIENVVSYLKIEGIGHVRHNSRLLARIAETKKS